MVVVAAFLNHDCVRVHFGWLMAREDDKTITGNLLRRIPPWAGRVTWDDPSGLPTASTQDFKDQHQELSVHVEAETTVEEVLEGNPGFGMVRFTAEEVRRICGDVVVICRDPPPPSHVLICGKLTGGMRDRLKRAAQWVKYPDRLDPITGQPVNAWAASEKPSQVPNGPESETRSMEPPPDDPGLSSPSGSDATLPRAIWFACFVAACVAIAILTLCFLLGWL